MKKIYLFFFLCLSSHAQLTLGDEYFDIAMEEYGKMNYEDSFYNMLESATQGNLEAAFYMGIFNLHGIGVPVNKRMAYVWFKVSERTGNTQSGKIAFEYFRDKYKKNKFVNGQIDAWMDIIYANQTVSN